MGPRRFRKSRNLTLAAMADLLREHVSDGKGGPNASTVSKHERGSIFPSPDYIEAWRRASEGEVQYEDFVDLRDASASACLNHEDERKPHAICG